jgi:hypothetical protein
MPPKAAPATVTTEERPDERLTLAWPDRARALKIVDVATFQLADAERAGAKDLLDLAEAKHLDTCTKTKAAWDAACEHRRSETGPLKEAIGIYDVGMKEFDKAEKQRARDAQRAIEQAQYTETAVEREKVVEHIENTGGTNGEVKAAIERPMPLPVGPSAVMATAAAPAKPNKSRVVEDWKGEITDVWALLEYAVKNNRRELIALVEPNKTAIGSIAKSTKGAMEVPGLRIWDEGKVTSLPKKPGVV